MLTLDSYYDCQVDAWALGIVLHELLQSKYPFNTANERDLMDIIIEKEIDFCSFHWISTSVEATDMVKQLLQKDPTKRLRVENICMHSWFTNQLYLKFIEDFKPLVKTVNM